MPAVACALSVVLISLGVALGQPNEYTWSVHDVSDGDHMVLGLKTVRADSTASLLVRNVRLAGILCPYPGQAFFKEGKGFTQNAVGTTFKEGKLKIVKEASPRWVVDFVLPNGQSLCRELLTQGLAWAQPSDLSLPEEREYSKDFKKLEDQARNEKRGLWADTDPTPPWKFVAQLPTESEAPGKANPSYNEAKAKEAGADNRSVHTLDPDVITKVMALMRQKGTRLAQVVQDADKGGNTGASQRQQLDRWADSELAKILEHGAKQEGDLIARNMSSPSPTGGSGPQTAGIMAEDVDPFVKEKVAGLMQREGDAIKQLVEAYKNGGRIEDFEAKVRQLDQQEDAEVKNILKENFQRKQEIVQRTVDSMPMSAFVIFWDWDNWDYRPVRRDVTQDGRWIGRIVQDRNGNVVWYDRPNGRPHWIRYTYLSGGQR
jgi:endonuclease YncB( thermonuclease family)